MKKDLILTFVFFVFASSFWFFIYVEPRKQELYEMMDNEEIQYQARFLNCERVQSYEECENFFRGRK